jgi:DNA-binding response OmpR family regulator
MTSDVIKGKAAGFLDYLTKPVDVEQLMHALRTALDNK